MRDEEERAELKPVVVLDRELEARVRREEGVEGASLGAEASVKVEPWEPARGGALPTLEDPFSMFPPAWAAQRGYPL